MDVDWKVGDRFYLQGSHEPLVITRICIGEYGPEELITEDGESYAARAMYPEPLTYQIAFETLDGLIDHDILQVPKTGDWRDTVSRPIRRRLESVDGQVDRELPTHRDYRLVEAPRTQGNRVFIRYREVD